MPGRLDRYEAAYLNGGGELAATIAVSSLLRARHLAPSPRRRQRHRLVARTAPPAGAHPVEWAAYQLVADRPGRLLREVQAGLASSSAMAAALFGTGVLWTADTEIALALRIPREHAAFTGGGWAGGGDAGGGGSCGGGGGCGGGCGG